MRPTSLVAALILLFLFPPATPMAQQQTASHPMDALTVPEVLKTVELLKAAGHADGDTRYPMIRLEEPPKAEVLSWRKGSDLKRAAFVILRRAGVTSEAVIDLTAERVVSHRQVPGVQPNILMEEWHLAANLTRADERWRDAVRKRGITEFDKVFCAPTMAGYLNEPGFPGRRLFRVPCYSPASSEHAYGLPIEGVMALVDTDTKTVIDVSDTGVVEVGEQPAAEALKTRPALKPVVNVSPSGANFDIARGYRVRWQNWSFHLRIERREGPIVSLVRYKDGDIDRLIAYQMALSEMIVPYMDPDPNWAYRSFMDAGEFGLGYLASTLSVGRDCPNHSAYLPAIVPSDLGGLFKVDNAVCVFERNTSDPAWRHHDATTNKTDSRANVELVVRTVPTIGNYDYVVDYVFKLNGNITVRVGATGIDAVKTVATRNMRDETAETDTRYGALVAPNRVAVYHDHYFSFRLDLDIDGQANRLVRDHLKPVDLGPQSARRSMWTLETNVIGQEGVADTHRKGRGTWRVLNANHRTGLGHHPSYELFPAHHVTSLLDPEDGPQKRAPFTAHELWVSRYHPNERHAAGRYTNEAVFSGGVTEFVRDAAPIQDEDIVLWYTVGFHHITRAEDGPVLPTRWHEFTLRPVNYFDRSPASDLAPNFQQTAQ